MNNKRSGMMMISSRPLNVQELEMMWQLLDERGDARLRLAAAAALEAGLRVREVCNLHLKDVDTANMQFFVRSPMSSRVRCAFFGEKTRKCFAAWMAERSPHCEDDHMIHGTLGKPLRPSNSQRNFVVRSAKQPGAIRRTTLGLTVGRRTASG